MEFFSHLYLSLSLSISYATRNKTPVAELILWVTATVFSLLLHFFLRPLNLVAIKSIVAEQSHIYRMSKNLIQYSISEAGCFQIDLF